MEAVSGWDSTSGERGKVAEEEGYKVRALAGDLMALNTINWSARISPETGILPFLKLDDGEVIGDVSNIFPFIISVN